MRPERDVYKQSLPAEKRWHAEVAKGTLTADEVAALLSPNNPDPALVTQLLTARQLLGILHEGEMRFPAYQFDGSAVRETIPALLTIAKRSDVPSWDIALWMINRSSLFAAQDRPADHLDDPERLLAAAETEFDAVW